MPDPQPTLPTTLAAATTDTNHELGRDRNADASLLKERFEEALALVKDRQVIKSVIGNPQKNFERLAADLQRQLDKAKQLPTESVMTAQMTYAESLIRVALPTRVNLRQYCRVTSEGYNDLQKIDVLCADEYDLDGEETLLNLCALIRCDVQHVKKYAAMLLCALSNKPLVQSTLVRIGVADMLISALSIELSDFRADILGILQHMTQHVDGPDAILDVDGLETLVDMLFSIDPWYPLSLERLLHILRNMADMEETRLDIYKMDGVVDQVVSFLTDKHNIQIRVAAMMLIRQLCESGEFQQAFGESAAMQYILVNASYPHTAMQEEAMAALCILTRTPENVELFVARGGIRPTVVQIYHSTLFSSEKAVATLLHMADTSAYQLDLFEAGAFRAAVHVLSGAPSLAQEHAAVFLISAIGNVVQSPLTVITDELAVYIDHFARLLQAPSVNVALASASALFNISSDKKHHTALATLNLHAINGLVNLLRTSGTHCREPCLGALINIASNPDYGISLIAAGASSAFIAVINDGPPLAVEQATGAIANLSVRVDHAQHLVREGVIDALVRVLGTGTVTARGNASIALLNIALAPENKVAIAKAGAISPLVKLLEYGTAVVQEQAGAALVALALNSDNRIAIQRAGAIPHLVQLLAQKSVDAHVTGTAALRNLALTPENHVVIIRNGALKPLISMLTSKSLAAQENAAGCLRSLASTDTSLATMIQKDNGLEPLIKILDTGSTRAQEQAAAAICSFASIANLRTLISKAGALPHLVNLCNNGTSGTREHAEAALRLLEKDSEAKKILAHMKAKAAEKL